MEPYSALDLTTGHVMDDQESLGHRELPYAQLELVTNTSITGDHCTMPCFGDGQYLRSI